MKKSISLILAVLMTLSLAACGGGGGSSDKGGALPGIDMKSTDTQTVTSDRATLEVLNETFFTYLGGLNYFTEDDAQSKLTYAELKEHIGVDCSDYRYEEIHRAGFAWQRAASAFDVIDKSHIEESAEPALWMVFFELPVEEQPVEHLAILSYLAIVETL